MRSKSLEIKIPGEFRKELTEKVIQNQILNWLFLQPDCFAWQNDSVGIFDPQKKIFRKRKGKYFIKGVSDILGIYRGKPLAIEVKRPGKKATTDQVEFLGNFIKHGGIAFVATSVEEVEHRLKHDLADMWVNSDEIRSEGQS